MCHETIDSILIEIQSQPNQNCSTYKLSMGPRSGIGTSPIDDGLSDDIAQAFCPPKLNVHISLENPSSMRHTRYCRSLLYIGFNNHGIGRLNL